MSPASPGAEPPAARGRRPGRLGEASGGGGGPFVVSFAEEDVASCAWGASGGPPRPPGAGGHRPLPQPARGGPTPAWRASARSKAPSSLSAFFGPDHQPHGLSRSPPNSRVKVLTPGASAGTVFGHGACKEGATVKEVTGWPRPTTTGVHKIGTQAPTQGRPGEGTGMSQPPAAQRGERPRGNSPTDTWVLGPSPPKRERHASAAKAAPPAVRELLHRTSLDCGATAPALVLAGPEPQPSARAAQALLVCKSPGCRHSPSFTMTSGIGHCPPGPGQAWEAPTAAPTEQLGPPGRVSDSDPPTGQEPEAQGVPERRGGNVCGGGQARIWIPPPSWCPTNDCPVFVAGVDGTPPPPGGADGACQRQTAGRACRRRL